MKFIKSAIVTFASNIAVLLLSFAITIITSRVLGTYGRGVIGVSNNINSFALIILGFGMVSSNVFFVGKDRKNIKEILGINLVITLFSIAVAVVLYIVNQFYAINILFKGLDNNTLIIVLITIPITNLKSAFINLLLGMQEIGKYNKLNIIDRFLTFLLLVVFIFTTKSVYWVIVSNMLASLMTLIIVSSILFIKYKNKIAFSMNLFRDMMKYGIKAQIGNAIQILNYRLDVFVIQYFLTISDVGIYSNAVVLAETMLKVSTSIATVVFPMTTNSKDKLGIKDFINKVTRVTFTIILIGSIILGAISKPLITLLFKKDFSSGSEALILLIPGIAIFSISNILANYLAGIGKIENNIVASTAGCIITVVLDLILIPKMGINGASIATSISYIVSTLVTIYYYIRITKSSLKELFIINKDDIKDIKNRVMALKKKLC